MCSVKRVLKEWRRWGLLLSIIGSSTKLAECFQLFIITVTQWWVWLSISSAPALLSQRLEEREREAEENEEKEAEGDLWFTQAVVEVRLGGRNKQAEGVT